MHLSMKLSNGLTAAIDPTFRKRKLEVGNDKAVNHG